MNYFRRRYVRRWLRDILYISPSLGWEAIVAIAEYYNISEMELLEVRHDG